MNKNFVEKIFSDQDLSFDTDEEPDVEIKQDYGEQLYLIPYYVQNIFRPKSGYEKNNLPGSSEMNPLRQLIITMLFILGYIYFANDFMCQLIGLYYPCYYLFIILHSNKITKKLSQFQLMGKYFILYGHVEFVSMILKFIGFPLFHHIKILVLAFFVYSFHYREWMNPVYKRMVMYDKIFLRMCRSLLTRILEEYTRAKKENRT